MGAPSSDTALVANTLMPAPSASSSSSMTPKMVQQMIMNAFSALGLSGNTNQLTSTLYLDSGMSNHMTFSSTNLSNLKKYDGNLRVHTADGGNVPISATSNVSYSLPLNHVFLSPYLTTNLLSVGQLVDNDCSMIPSHFLVMVV